MARTAPPDELSRREQRRLQHQDLSRAQLLDAAEEVFGRKGFHEATLKEVAELAEFSVGSVYSFFTNKDDLFRQIFVRRGQEFMPGLREAVQPGDGTVTDQLHGLVDFEVGFFRARPHFGRLYLRYSTASTMSTGREIDAGVTINYDEAMHLQAGLFERGQAAGEFHRGDPLVFSRLFSGLISSYQAIDPAVVGEAAGDRERFPLPELHALIERTFVISHAR